jgi:hypothetical protein
LKAHFLRTAKRLKAARDRLQRIHADLDLPELHRLSVDLQTSLPENLAHEYRPLLLDALRVEDEENIASYVERLEPVLTQLLQRYREKAGVTRNPR